MSINITETVLNVASLLSGTYNILIENSSVEVAPALLLLMHWDKRFLVSTLLYSQSHTSISFVIFIVDNCNITISNLDPWPLNEFVIFFSFFFPYSD